MDKKTEFKPYIPAEKITPEITVTSIIMGVILAVVFGAANAYLGLRVGMTVSASIPSAVIAMGVIKMIMRKNSVLETNNSSQKNATFSNVCDHVIKSLRTRFGLSRSIPNTPVRY